jgi:lipoprotein-anchoring transpeptidase ErfK/SrfK
MADDVHVEVDRDRFRLRVYRWDSEKRRYVRTASYKVAVGAVGYATPPGPYRIMARSRTPDWKAPDWSEHAGEIFKFDDARNPFDGGFIALGGHPSTRGDGVGLHGTKFDPALGTRASHGCIRMSVPDFLDLWDRVPNGADVTVY